MIRVTIGNNVYRTDIITPETTTLREVLDANGINYMNGSVLHLDGTALQSDDLDKTFEDFGITPVSLLDTGHQPNHWLLSVIKADNA